MIRSAMTALDNGSRRWLWAWVGLLVIAALTRLVDLESRVLSHDESLHAHFSHRLLEYNSYEQHPAYHGPLLYHLAAVSFAVFGDSDASARLPVALSALAAFGLLLPFGRYVGKRAAWLAGVLMLISPSLLFYARYMRNDLLIVAVTLGWAYSLLRYLENRERQWLWPLGLCLLLSFAAKEVSFITGLIFGLFVLALAIRRQSPAIGLPATRLLDAWRATTAAARDLALLMLTLVLPFAAGGVSFLLGWPVLDDGTSETLSRTLVSVGLCVLVSVGLGLWWFAAAGGRDSNGGPGWRTWALLFASFWATLWLLFSGLFANFRAGFVNGTSGSLGYWLQQQEVARGEQPWFYYLMLLALYEVLPVALAAGALLGARRVPRPLEETGDIGSSPNWPLLVRDFLIWWALASLLAYSVASEKMPWLVVHTVLPLLLLGGIAAARLSRSVERTVVDDPTVAGLVCLGALFPIALIMLLGGRPFEADDAAGLAQTMRWLTTLLATLLLVFAARRLARPLESRTARRWLLIGVLLTIGLWSVRTAWRASYVNDDLATELLVYAHSAPDVKVVMQEIERLATRRGWGTGLEVAYTSEVAWPFAWYLRSLPGTRLLDDIEPEIGSADVVLTSSTPTEALWTMVARGYAERRYRRTWWPVESYRVDGLGDLGQRLTSLETWRQIRDVALHRRYRGATLRDWPLREDMSMFVRSDLEPLGDALPQSLTGLASKPALGLDVLSPEPLWVSEGLLAGMPLSAPAGVAAWSQGGWLVADSGNNRVLGIDANGAVDLAIDSAEGVDFDQPWGVAWRSTGDLAIADTWNGRVVLLAAGDDPAAAVVWQPDDDHGSLRGPLYGPRALAYDDRGQLAISDTGNGRVLLVSVADHVADHRAVVVAERFREPVGLTFANATLLLADSANRTLRFLDSQSLEPVSGRRLNAWHGSSVNDKPFLAQLDSGLIVTSVPARGGLMVLEPNGSPRAFVDIPHEADEPPRPVGVAVSRGLEQELVAVTDIDNNRLLVFNASDLQPSG